ncbi:energy transducer TonB [Acidobacteriota bacterium]
MKKRQFYLMNCAALLVFVLLFGQALIAAPDILVDLRLYQGEREKKSEKPTVVTSYYLRPIFSAGKILDIDLSDEKDELKKIFNLVGIKLMTQAKWAWKTGLRDRQLELVVLNGKKFSVQLILLQKKDHFKLEVLERGQKKDKKKLESTLIIPQGKTSVFGFEDSMGKPYFLSCQRHPDKAGASDEPVKVPAMERPNLIRKIKPVYPKEALRAKIQGQVNAEVVTDIYGRVVDISKIEGHPVLNEATVKALRQWVYEPFIMNGKPKFVTFTVVVSFSLDKKSEEANIKVDVPAKISSIKKPKLIKKINPQYPAKAIEEGIAGEVIMEVVTDVCGRVEKVTKAIGHPLLTVAARDAVKQWKYELFTVDGKPKAVKFTVVVNFNLDKKTK